MEERWQQMEERYGTLFQDRKAMILSGDRIYDLIEEMRIYGKN
jgi:DNA polymerase IV